MTARSLESSSAILALSQRAARSSEDGPLRAAEAGVGAARCRSRALELSRSRTHGVALDILKAYKLSGNFHSNLEVVLKDMGVFGLVAYRIEPGPAFGFPDRRHVVFTLNDNVAHDRFDDIVKSIEDRIGFDVPWWGRLLRRGVPMPNAGVG